MHEHVCEGLPDVEPIGVDVDLFRARAPQSEDEVEVDDALAPQYVVGTVAEHVDDKQMFYCRRQQTESLL